MRSPLKSTIDDNLQIIKNRLGEVRYSKVVEAKRLSINKEIWTSTITYDENRLMIVLSKTLCASDTGEFLSRLV